MKRSTAKLINTLAIAGAIAAALAAMPAAAYNFPDTDRWNFWTAIDGSFNASQGDPINLTWSILPDDITTAGTQGSGPSALISMFDGIYGSGPGGPDLTQRPWFNLFSDSYNRYNELTGINFVFEPGNTDFAGDDTNPMSTNRDGILETRGDIRLGASPIDGFLGTLAYAFGPQFGEIVLDTGDASLRWSIPNDAQNIIMHETGHSLGMGHINSSDARFLLEPGIQPAIYGPQFDDLLGLQRAYGDFYEKSNNGQGNNTRNNATNLGNLNPGPIPGNSQTLSIGTDAGGLQIAREQTDFVSIDGSSDLDFFSFTLEDGADVEIILTPKGPEYSWRNEGSSTLNSWDASALNNLNLQLLDEDGSILAQSASAGTGGAESVLYNFDEAGTYFVRVNGQANAVQFYQLDVTATAIPEPTSLAIFAATGLLLRTRRRKTC